MIAGQRLAGAQGAGGYLSGDAMISNTLALNLRANVSAGAEVLAELETGATATILSGSASADGRTWYRVETVTGPGRVAGDCLSLA